MIISTSDIAAQAVITATPDSSLQDIIVISDGDFSSVYTDALPAQVDINLDFNTPVNIGYLSIAGSNVAKKDSIDIYIDEVLFVSETLGKTESNNLMFVIDDIDVSNIRVEIYGSGSFSISELAVGDYYEVTRGEQGGYKKAWTVPNIESRSASSLQNTPVNLSYESRPLKITLSEPNNIMADFDGWYTMINFAASNTFYILEDDDPTHSYACFNAVPSMTSAHSQSGRKLGVSGITFSAFAKSSEVIF